MEFFENTYRHIKFLKRQNAEYEKIMLLNAKLAIFLILILIFDKYLY